MAIQLFEYPTPGSNLKLRVAHGHFATSHSHNNYYIDFAITKHRLSEAREVAVELAGSFRTSTVVDSILCLDGTEVIGACMASELTKAGITNANAHRTIYVLPPEHTSGSQLIFRDNTAPMIVGKHVLVLAASVTTGFTVNSIFNTDNVLDDYQSCDAHDCPMCKAGIKLDGLVNAHGISTF